MQVGASTSFNGLRISEAGDAKRHAASRELDLAKKLENRLSTELEAIRSALPAKPAPNPSNTGTILDISA